MSKGNGKAPIIKDGCSYSAKLKNKIKGAKTNIRYTFFAHSLNGKMMLVPECSKWVSGVNEVSLADIDLTSLEAV